MAQIIDRPHFAYHRTCLERLTEDTPARWGDMTASAMVCHLRAMVELSLGEREVQRLATPWIGRPVGWVMFYVMTRWPKGQKGSTPPVPALCPTPIQSFADEREQLFATLERFIETRHKSPKRKTGHPIFGATSLQYWSRIHGVHARHHYRQFGIA